MNAHLEKNLTPIFEVLEKFTHLKIFLKVDGDKNPSENIFFYSTDSCTDRGQHSINRMPVYDNEVECVNANTQCKTVCNRP